MPLTEQGRHDGWFANHERMIRERDDRWRDIDVLLSRSEDVPSIVAQIGVSANTLARQAQRAAKTAETRGQREYWRKRANIFARYERRERQRRKT